MRTRLSIRDECVILKYIRKVIDSKAWRKDATVTEKILAALEASDGEATVQEFRKEMSRGADPWQIHLSLFPIAQRVINPPFFNGHFPKMYGVCRDLIAYLEKEEITALVQLELNEYARRPLVEFFSKPDTLPTGISFADIRSAIREQDREKAVVLMSAFQAQAGGKELARRLLFLGSGYLKESLGHSVSCTAFILREMLKRPDQDAWPCLLTLSDFFCKAKFDSTPELNPTSEDTGAEISTEEIARATMGRGIINLHHTITAYALESSRPLFNQLEYSHLLKAWVDFMGKKKCEQESFTEVPAGPQQDYSTFYEIFKKREARPVADVLSRGRIPNRFLLKGLLDQYQGNYDPHYLTGLASALWVTAQYHDQGSVALSALYQYLDFYFENLKTKTPGTIF